ncbi:MAG: DUF3619 domain-containing protein [Betaproteobacteria bacterium HGW-Betaproteobacteria-3]|jgi:hypothetical protein|nr:MAG: DUF3619 domain-containing protein [Betaproteobacteria bacterium HGW-Betaproteobacteria-3]
MTNSRQHQTSVLLDRYGLKVAARLSDGTDALPHDIAERLRVARLQAVAQRKVAPVRVATSVHGGSAASLTFGDEKPNFWGRMGAAVPLVALAAGLIVINVLQSDNRANELAEVDIALLTDDLPPAAYADPGFAQFLKAERSRQP